MSETEICRKIVEISQFSNNETQLFLLIIHEKNANSPNVYNALYSETI